MRISRLAISSSCCQCKRLLRCSSCSGRVGLGPGISLPPSQWPGPPWNGQQLLGSPGYLPLQVALECCGSKSATTITGITINFLSYSRNLVDSWSFLRALSSPWFPWRFQLAYVHPVYWACRFLNLFVTPMKVWVVYIIHQFGLSSLFLFLSKLWVYFTVLTVSMACSKPTWLPA